MPEKTDVREAQDQPTRASAGTPPQPKTSPAYVPRLQPAVLGQDKTEPISGIRKAMVKAMVKSQAVPHFGYSDEVICWCYLRLLCKDTVNLLAYFYAFGWLLFRCMIQQ